MNQIPMTDAEREKKVAEIREHLSFHGLDLPWDQADFLLAERDRLQQERIDLIVRCHCCKGTQIWKRNEAGEIEIYHDCAAGLHSMKERAETAEADLAKEQERVKDLTEKYYVKRKIT